MSQGAGADDSKSNRFSNPAHVYGPMVYQFPPDHGIEKEREKPKSNQGVNFLVLLLIIVLAVGGVILYLKENGIDIRRLSFKPGAVSRQIFGRPNENQQPPPAATQARVAVESLYLREGPGAEYVATYLLPEDWELSLLGENQIDNNGDVWARVLVETEQGPQEGWVSRRYVE